MRSIVVLALALLVVISFAVGVSAAPYTMWTVLGSSKYLQTEAPTKSVPVSLDAARNEWEPFQVIIRADQPISSVNVSAEDLKSTSGTIASSNIDIRLARYIELKDSVGGGFPKGFYPDALVPMPWQFAVSQGKTQMVWVNVHIPMDAKPGLYSGKLTFNIDGKTEEVPIGLLVRDFALSVKNHFGSAFALWSDQVAQYYGLRPDSRTMQTLLAQYYWFMIDYRLCPDDLPVPITSPDADGYINDPRVTSFRLPYDPDQPDEFVKEAAYVRDKGWLPKAYIYTLDEPAADQFAGCATYGKRIDSLAKDAKWLLTTAPNKTLNGTVDIWCPVLHDYNPEACAKRQAAGDEVWWYTCCVPQHPYPTYLINDTATAPRILSWFQYLNRVQGVLYWSTSIWLKYDGTKYVKRDVWNDPLAFPGANGDGYLIYPGKTPQNDPVPSLRLEMLRQGNEDFETLYLLQTRYAALAKSLGLSKADYDPHSRGADFVGKVGVSLTKWNRNPAVIDSVRKMMLNDIDSTSRGPKVIVATSKPEGSYDEGTKILVTIWAEKGTSVAVIAKIGGKIATIPVKLTRSANGKCLKGKFSITTGQQPTILSVNATKGKSMKTIARVFNCLDDEPLPKLKDPNVVSEWKSDADVAKWQRDGTDIAIEKTKAIGDAAKVTFHSGAEYPNVMLAAPKGFSDTDWSKRGYLNITFYNPNSFNVALVGKLFDSAGGKCDGLRIYLGPHESHMETWNLTSLPTAIDLSKFSAIEIWTSNPSKPITVYIGTIATTAEKPE